MHGETPNSAGQRQERSALLLSGLLFGKNELFKFITSAKKFNISSPLMFCGLQTNKPQRTTETRMAADAGPNAHHRISQRESTNYKSMQLQNKMKYLK